MDHPIRTLVMYKYGLYCGIGLDPDPTDNPEEVQSRLKEKYGGNPQFRFAVLLLAKDEINNIKQELLNRSIVFEGTNKITVLFVEGVLDLLLCGPDINRLTAKLLKNGLVDGAHVVQTTKTKQELLDLKAKLKVGEVMQNEALGN